MVKFFQRKYIILALGFLALFLVFLFAQDSFFKRENKIEIMPPSKIKIDFGILESQEVQELEPFEKIEYFKGEIGRENPFLPY